jgi:hypothetical protein
MTHIEIGIAAKAVPIYIIVIYRGRYDRLYVLNGFLFDNWLIS